MIRDNVTMREPLRVLMVEDVPTEAELELRELKRAGMQVHSRVVAEEQAFRDAVETFEPHIILSDFSMPNWDGMSALAAARDLRPHTPFIFVSGTLGEEYAIRALQNGAADYVLKTNLVRLPSAVERAVREAEERRELQRAESDLEALHERLHSIFTTLADVLWAVSLPDRKLIYASPAFADLTGYAHTEFEPDIGALERILHPQDVVAARGDLLRVLEQGQVDADYRIRHADGRQRWVNLRARLVRNALGEPERIDGVARDVTERMEQRDRIARLSRIREVLSSINAALLRLRERGALLDEACRVAVDVGGFASAYIAMRDAGAAQAGLAAARGLAPALAFPVPIAEAERAAESVVGRVLRTGEVVIVADVERDAVVVDPQAQLRSGVHSAAGFPLFVDEVPVGALVLRATERDFFDHEEIRLLRALAANISFALELISRQEEVNYLAYYDPLTGLPNRAMFQDRVGQILDAAARSQSMAALIVLDVERFKVINDTLGQHAGDRLLQEIARRLRAVVPDANHLARLAGDQFTIVLPAVRDEAAVVRALGRHASEFLEKPFEIDGRELRIAAKVGVAIYPGDGADAETLYRNAEAALKRAKVSGERYLFYAPHINARVSGRLDLENRLRKAVELRQFVLHYQPKVDLRSAQITGLEALIRWNDPGSGLVPPVQFIPLLEETGLIREVGRWAMEEAIRTHRAWRERGLLPPRIAVNMSAIQLRQRDLVAEIHDVVGGAGEQSGLDIEITESLLMENIEESIGKLQAIRDMGIRISVDDFGTGYSSLSYINKLPVNTLKIDRSFVNGMTDDEDKSSIVATIVSLARALRLKVVAEGVETDAQASLLRELRCDEMQGYLFCRPMEADRVAVLLEGKPH